MVRRNWSHSLYPGLTPIRSPHPPHPYDHTRPRQRRAQASRSPHLSPSSNNRMCMCTRAQPICNAQLTGMYTVMCHRCNCLHPLPHFAQTLGSYKRNHNQPGATSFVILVALVQLIRRSKYRSSGHPRYRNCGPRSTFCLCRVAHVSLYKGHFPSADGPQ